MGINPNPLFLTQTFFISTINLKNLKSPKKVVNLFYMNKIKPSVFFFVVLISLSGCSTTKLTVDLTADAVKQGIGAFYEESDLELARRGIEANIKLMEVFYKADPQNKNLRILLSQAYAGYSFIFLETDLLYANNKIEAEKITARINDFYRRGLRYGLSILEEDSVFKKAVEKNDLELFASCMSRITEKEALFWTVFNWSLLLNMNRDSVDTVADLPKLHLLADRMIYLDKSFTSYAPLALKATLECSMPKMLGGKPDKGVKMMEEALAGSNRSFLAIQFLYAEYCTPAVQDKKMFLTLVNEIEKTDAGINNDVKLINKAVKLKMPAVKKSVIKLFED
jgi:hypothetical protein